MGVGEFRVPTVPEDPRDKIIDLDCKEIPVVPIWNLAYDEPSNSLVERKEKITEAQYNSLLVYGEILDIPPPKIEVYAPKLGEIVRDIMNDPDVPPLVKLKISYFWEFLQPVVEM